MLKDLEDIVQSNVQTKQRRAIIEFHLQRATERLRELSSPKARRKRSINWLGSAWKWIAGSPDATDWNMVLANENMIVTNNNQQYKINEKLMNVSLEATKRINQLITKFNNIDKETDHSTMELDVLHRTLIVKEEISELVRACQMARSGIVNGNLLDRDEIDRLLVEVETLPYQNIVEAIEYAKPTVLSNGTMLLYILAMPKVREEEYRFLIARSASVKERRIKLEYQELLVSRIETYGLTNDCYSISNTTVCEMNCLKKLAEEECLPRLLKGGHASCNYEPNNGEVIELIEDNTIFLTKYNGKVQGENRSVILNGTYLIEMKNETVWIGNHNFSSKTTTYSRALPPVLSNVTMKEFTPSLEFIHSLNMENISRIGKLGKDFQISTGIELIIILILIIACLLIWKKITTEVQLPRTNTLQNLDHSLVTHINLRDADI